MDNSNIAVNNSNIAVIYYGNEKFLDSLGTELYGKFDKDVIILTESKNFPNLEIYPRIPKNIRRKNVYVVSNFTGYDKNGSLEPNVGYMRLFLLNDAIKRSSPNEINNVLPFIPYLRQERKDKPRVPISARVLADLLQKSGATRLSTIDMHAKAIEGFYDIPVDNLTAIKILGDELVNGNYGINEKDWILVAPDAGAMERVITFKGYLFREHEIDLKIAMTEKIRGKEGELEIPFIVGDVEGKNIIEVDDMIDSAGTLCEGKKKLEEKGAKKIVACCTHGLFSMKGGRGAEDRLREAGIFVISTDTIPRTNEYIEENKDWLKTVSVSPLLSEAIYRINEGGSISELYPEGV